jgi:hypothetical protein
MKPGNIAFLSRINTLPGRINGRLTVFLSLFVTVVIFSGCCPNPETYDIPVDFKPYIYFPEDSYWIYRSQDNEYDTLRLVNLENTISNSNTEKCVSFLNIDADYKSSWMGEFNSRTSWNGNSMILYCCSSMNMSYFNETSNFIKNDADEPQFRGCNTTCYWEIDSSEIVNSVEYKRHSGYLSAVSGCLLLCKKYRPYQERTSRRNHLGTGALRAKPIKIKKPGSSKVPLPGIGFILFILPLPSIPRVEA